MDKLIELLFREPLLLFVVGAWIFGMIGNAAKAKKKVESRRRARPATQAKIEAAVQKPVVDRRRGVVTQPSAAGNRSGAGATATPPPPPIARSQGRLAGSAAQTPEQIALEMRRVLGLEAGAPPRASKSVAPKPPSNPVAPPPISSQPEGNAAIGATRDRSLKTRVDPHVGERIRDRHMAESKVGVPRAGQGALGGLGGRVKHKQRAATRGSRYSLDDLRKAIVINEILNPPVSMRSYDERRPD